MLPYYRTTTDLLSGNFAVAEVNLRLQKGASQTQFRARVSIWDVVGRRQRACCRILRDGHSPSSVATYRGVTFFAALLNGFRKARRLLDFYSQRDARPAQCSSGLTAPWHDICFWIGG